MVDRGAGLVKVLVEKVAGLPERTGAFDKTDPYVKLTLKTNGGREGESFRTKTKNNSGANAVFNEELIFNKKEDEDVLEVSIYDDDTGSDDLICQRLIDLDEIKTGKVVGKSTSTPYQLTKDGHGLGQIYLTITFDI